MEHKLDIKTETAIWGSLSFSYLWPLSKDKT